MENESSATDNFRNVSIIEAPLAIDRRPRVGFLGTGWIGGQRLRAIAECGAVEIAAVFDSNPEAAALASRTAAGAPVLPSFTALLGEELDGIVIATPTALHAEQTRAALEAGVAVLCQKPLALNAAQAGAVIGAAKRADRLLAVDMSYRFLRSAGLVKQLIDGGEIGAIFAADLVFHNAYGPDKAWYYAPALAGGGCVIDLGVHLIDLALWMLNGPRIDGVTSRLFSQGQPIRRGEKVLEDFAIARLDLDNDCAVQFACSWRLAAGRDALIRATFYGTQGALEIANVNGSFYDFAAELCRGTSRVTLDRPPDNWGGRAAVLWAEQLARSPRFDPAIESAAVVAAAIDRIYRETGELKR